MKTISLILPALMCICPVMLVAQQGVAVKTATGETLHIANSDIKSMTFDQGNAVITSTDGQQLAIDCNSIIDISHIDAVATEYTVAYNGATATVVNPYVLKGVSTEIDGAYVVTTNTNVADELV